MEDLSQLLDEPVDSDSVKSLRQRMLDKTVRLSIGVIFSGLTHCQVYVRGRHELLLKDTADGLAEGRWEWIEPLE